VKPLKFLLLTTFFLCFTGCEDKKTDIPEKSGKTIVSDMNKQTQKDETLQKEMELRKKYTFMLSDINETNHSISVKNKYIEISDVNQKIILINLFATWCPPCRGEIPYLTDLQTKYKDTLFIAGILVNDSPDKEALQTFLDQYAINYFVSNSEQNNALAKLAAEKLQLEDNFSIPLTILFKGGHYYSHYEGAVPVEMLEHDIKNALNKE